MMKSSFRDDDCFFLLKDLTGIIPFTPFDEKESLIAEGHSYSEMITEEEPLPMEINDIFKSMVSLHASDIARYVATVSEEILRRFGENVVIVSLARAGSPVGALIRRYIIFKYNIPLPHYSISIIRGRGIDRNALNYILRRHPLGRMEFVDGWTGKGSISSELKKDIKAYNSDCGTSISDCLAVLADPAHVAEFAGTRNDVCIPNACLNSTVSGLVSRTILNNSYIGPNDFHGAVRYDNFREDDMTNFFLSAIEHCFSRDNICPNSIQGESPVGEVIERLARDFPLANINKVKLSIGESSRALIRRKPYIVLVKNPSNRDLSFVLFMAKKRGVEVRQYDTMNYECITLLK